MDDLGINHGNAWGDWLAQGAKTPLDYVDTVYFAISSRMMSEMAAATGRHAESERYRRQFERTKAAFVKEYLADDGSVRVKTQTAHALALFAELIPDGRQTKTAQRLAEMIELNGNHMATGFLGTRPLLPVLSAADQHDLATFLLQSREFPSWGYEIEQGATSIWERWDSFTREDGFGRHNAAMNSFSHYAFGAVCEWMFHTLAGIQSDGPGYQKIIIAPRPPTPGSNAQHEPIHWVNASYDSIQGSIVSRWKLIDDRFLMDVGIPTNTTATVYVPAQRADRISLDGGPLSQSKLVRVLSEQDGRVALEVPSGKYRFESTHGMVQPRQALNTFQPADLSINPENIDLTDARVLLSWDFTREADVAKWPARNNLKIEKRGAKVFLVGTGADPQLATTLPQPLSGPLAIALKARPAKGTSAQFFWASPGGGFNARQQNQRPLNPSPELNTYLFRLGDDQPLGKLRLDPFAGQGEIEIQSITIYQTR